MKNLLFFILIIASVLARAESSLDVWTPVANTVCKQVNDAFSVYQKGDLKNAHLQAVMSYFKGYDAQMEPAARITLGGPHVFALEKQFRDYASAMTPNPDTSQLKKVSTLAEGLCEAMQQEAKALNEAKVPLQTFKVDP